MSHIKRITKYVVNVFTYILFAILILTIYGKATITFTDKSYPNYFGYTFFEVASGSMEPTLHKNDVILVKITKDNLKNDDIIAYQSGKSIITHRIIFIDNDTLGVKGDNNNTADRPIKKDIVIGKVIKIYEKLGIWKKVLTEPKILVAIFITLLLFDFALSYTKTVEIKDESIDNGDKPQEEEPKIETVKLLDLTRKIDVEEINALLDGTNFKLENNEVQKLKSKIEDIKIAEEPNEIIENLDEKEKNFIEYTIRLDLDEIRKNIDKNVK